MSNENRHPVGHGRNDPGSSVDSKNDRQPAARSGSRTLEDLERELLERHEKRERPADAEPILELVRFYMHWGWEDRLRPRVLAFMGEAGVDPEIRAWCRLLLGQSFERTRDYESAVAHYREGVACEPCEPFTAYFLHNNLGYSLVAVGRPDEAEWYCRTAIRIDGTLANGHKNLGLSLAGQGDEAGALRCWIQATHVDPGDPRALDLAERLVEKRPDLRFLVPGLEEELDECRRSVRAARERTDGE